MANSFLLPRSALSSYWHGGHYGRVDGVAGVTLKEIRNFELVEITTYRGQKYAVSDRLVQSFGLALPAPNKTTTGNGIRFISIGPSKYLAIAEENIANNLLARLENALTGLAAVVDQSDARAIVEISGNHARKALAKGIMIDLDASVFHNDDAASTFAVQLWITLWQENSLPTYRLSVFRAFGANMLHWLTVSAMEFGCELLDK